MPEVTGYANGVPSWVDLGTTDVADAERFYGGLFGWESDRQSMGENMFYSMQQIGGKNVAAIYDQREEQKEMGIPPNWLTYITVDDVDATTAKVSDAGGSVMQEAFDVFDAGRMSIIVDPSGAVVSFWQAKSRGGSELSREHGTISWNELVSTDAPAAAAFFAEVLGVKPVTMGTPGTDEYTMLMVDDAPVAGVMQRPDDMGDMPSHWTVYFNVDDCEATVEKAKSSGGKVIVPPMDISPGRFSVLQDPQGAIFAVIKIDPDYSPGG